MRNRARTAGEDECRDENRTDARRGAHGKRPAEQDFRAAVAGANEQAGRDKALWYRQQVSERKTDHDEDEAGDLLKDALVHDASQRADENPESDEDGRKAGDERHASREHAARRTWTPELPRLERRDGR